MRHSRLARRKAKSRPQTIAYKLHNCLSPESAISTQLKKGPIGDLGQPGDLKNLQPARAICGNIGR
jgi:hypothetical protein